MKIFRVENNYGIGPYFSGSLQRCKESLRCYLHPDIYKENLLDDDDLPFGIVVLSLLTNFYFGLMI